MMILGSIGRMNNLKSIFRDDIKDDMIFLPVRNRNEKITLDFYKFFLYVNLIALGDNRGIYKLEAYNRLWSKIHDYDGSFAQDHFDEVEFIVVKNYLGMKGKLLYGDGYMWCISSEFKSELMVGGGV
jgi:hypothetical protein